MKLNETIELMSSGDYKERFKAEYNQLAIRYSGLKSMLEKWDDGMLMFKPNCPRGTYNMQIAAMIDYLAVLETRAAMEDIEINNILRNDERSEEEIVSLFVFSYSSGIGNIPLKHNKKLSSEDIVAIQKDIEKEINKKNVVIINIIKI